MFCALLVKYQCDLAAGRFACTGTRTRVRGSLALEKVRETCLQDLQTTRAVFFGLGGLGVFGGECRELIGVQVDDDTTPYLMQGEPFV